MGYYKSIAIIFATSFAIHIKPIFADPFAQKHNSHLYWEALVQVARGNKESALHIVEALRDNLTSSVAPAWQEELPHNIDDFFDKLFVHSAMHDPELLGSMGLLEAIGIREHKAHLTEISLEHMLQGIEEHKKNLHRLQQYSFKALSRDQIISHKIFAWQLEQAIAARDFLFHRYVVSQMHSFLHAITRTFTQFHTIEIPEDVEHYITRLSKIPQKFQQALTFIALQKEKGIVPPQCAIDRVIAMLQRTIPQQAEETIFYRYLAQNIHKINTHNTDELLARARHTIDILVTPAYRVLEKYLVELRDVVTANHGVWSLPHGDEYYAYMLKQHTTTDLSADEIHVLGLQEVERIQNEMRSILAAEHLNDATKSVGVLLQELAQDPRFYYPNTEQGRKQCLDDYKTIIERSRKELSPLFGLKPKTGVVVQRVPEHEEAGASLAYYVRPSMDGSRPGSFYINLRDMNESPIYGMETLAVHEAEPGHHFQRALQNEIDLPILRKLGAITAYDEGWALYTEKLAYEHGFYSSPFAQLGHLRDELLRAARLVIDTGIHHKRWTYEQAIAYMEATTGFHHNEVVSEIERYFVMPGQACAYKIGQLKILELRKRAQDALGEKFSIQEFHDEVLKVATVPLEILEEVIDTYIQHKRIKIKNKCTT